MTDFVHALIASVRSLSRRPLYPLAAVFVLALGLSAGVAVFTYVNGFYQPFPGVDPGGLVRVFGMTDEESYQDISYLDFRDYADVGDALEGIAASQPYYAASVRLETMTEVAFLEAVSGEFFSVLGLRLGVGRGITPDDDRPGAESVAVLSHDWWERSFNADPEVIGRTIYLNFRPFTVVGVMAPEFLGTTSDFRPDVWIPIAPFKDRYTSWAALAEDRDVPLVRVFARMGSRRNEQQAEAQLMAVAAGLDAMYPREDGPRRIDVAAATWIDPRVRLGEWSTVRLMMIAAMVLLLLVCANVANLLLAVALGRKQESAIRAALGASPGRLMRQVLLENVVLSMAAGGLALLLAGPASARLGSYFARPSVWGANVAREVTVDWRVVLFTIGISLLTGIAASLLPALGARRRNLLEVLQIGGAHAGPRRHVWGRRVPGVHDMLVAAQVALSVVLLVVAGLVLRTFQAVSDVDPGFGYDRLIVTHISTSSTTLEAAERDRFFRDLAADLSREPWVSAATVEDYPLLSPHREAEFRLDAQTDPVNIVYSKVIPGFFAALDIPVIGGRSFTPGDTGGARRVAMVNQSFGRRFLGGDDAVGSRIWWPERDGTADREVEIVGVVRDTRTQDLLTEPEPTVYLSYPQYSYPTGSALMVATQGDPAAEVPRLYRWLRDYEPHLAIVNVVTYRDVVRGFLYTQRMNAELFSVLAFLGLGLAAVGIFSVMSLAVNRRTREIGIRMSIGAARRDIGRLMVGRALVPVVAGLTVGLTVSLAGAELVRSLLWGIEPTDPVALAAGAAVLVVAAITAAYLPARRAAAVDPLISLRSE